MKINIVLWPSTELHLRDVTNNIEYMLEKQGYLSSDIQTTQAFVTDDNTVNIVVGAVAYTRHPMVIPPGSIIVNMEQLYDESNWNTQWYRDLLTNPQMKIMDYNYHNQKWLQQSLNLNNVPVITFAQYPIEWSYKTIKDIDILFYGGLNPRRMKFMTHIYNYAVKNNISFITRNNLYMYDRINMINRSKIVINCHYHDIALLEWPRVQHLICNKAFVISEDSINKDEYKDYCKIVYSALDDPEDMREKIAYYLQHEDERERIAEECYSSIQNKQSYFPTDYLPILPP